MNTPAQPEGETLVQAHRVLNEYAERDSCIDNGNLYFAACAFRDELAATKAKLDMALEVIRLNAPHEVYITSYRAYSNPPPTPPQADSGEAK